MPLLKGVVCAFKEGVLKLNRLLGLVDKKLVEPDTVAKVVPMLTIAPRRIRALLDSAARGGAHMALNTVVSSYPALNLSLLGGVRTDSDNEMAATWEEISRVAAAMGSWVDPLHYIPLRDDDGEEVPAATMSELQDNMYSERDDSASASRPRPF